MGEGELAKALAALVPQVMPEYCLAWADRWWPWDYWWLCMSKGEWASWAQGLGTLVAIAGTIIGAHWVATEQERRALRQVKATAITQARLISNSLGEALMQVRQLTATRDLTEETLLKDITLLNEIIVDAREIRSDVLGLQLVAAIYAVRILAIEFVNELEVAKRRRDANVPNYQAILHTAATYIEEKLHTPAGLIRAKFPGVHVA